MYISYWWFSLKIKLFGETIWRDWLKMLWRRLPKKAPQWFARSVNTWFSVVFQYLKEAVYSLVVIRLRPRMGHWPASAAPMAQAWNRVGFSVSSNTSHCMIQNEGFSLGVFAGRSCPHPWQMHSAGLCSAALVNRKQSAKAKSSWIQIHNINPVLW